MSETRWAYCPQHGYSPAGLRSAVEVEDWRVAHNVAAHRGSDMALVDAEPAPAAEEALAASGDEGSGR